MEKAVVILNGGLHSTTALAVAKNRGFEVYAISFDYGQPNRVKLEAAKQAAKDFGVVEHKIVPFDIRGLLVSGEVTDETELPVVEKLPGRNPIFLSFAASWAQILKATNLYIGVNSIDYGHNPECTPDFIHIFQHMANASARFGNGYEEVSLWSPFMKRSTAEVILRGTDLGVDYSKTHSCQNITTEPLACGECVNCQIRKRGFAEARITDPTQYK